MAIVDTVAAAVLVDTIQPLALEVVALLSAEKATLDTAGSVAVAEEEVHYHKPEQMPLLLRRV